MCTHVGACMLPLSTSLVIDKKGPAYLPAKIISELVFKRLAVKEQAPCGKGLNLIQLLHGRVAEWMFAKVNEHQSPVLGIHNATWGCFFLNPRSALWAYARYLLDKHLRSFILSFNEWLTVYYKPGNVFGAVGNDAMTKQEQSLSSRGLLSSKKGVEPVVRIRSVGC